MPGEPSQIPVGTQFTPTLVHLPSFLAALVADSGDKPNMSEAIWASPVNLRKKKGVPSSRRQASLPLEAAVQYELLDGDYAATDLCKELAALNESDLYDAFARHILLNLGGLRVIEGAQQMREDGLKVTADELAGYLTDQGFTVSIHNTAINSLRMWLAEAGLFPKGRAKAWEVNDEAKERLVGFDDETIAAIVGFTEDQRAYAIALCRIAPKGEYPASDLRDLAETISGHRIDRGNLPTKFLEPLKHAGLITYKTKGTAGGKTSVLETTSKFDTDVLAPFLERTVESLDAALTAYYKKPVAEIYEQLSSTDTYVKGEALEAYAVHIMRLLGLRFVSWRKRAKDETGQAEIDVVMAGIIGGIATRWQIQCKNKPSSGAKLEDVAKEVGLVPLTKATHVMVIVNGPVTADAYTYAREVMRNSSITVFILDKDDFDKIKASPGAIASIIRAKSTAAERVDRHGLKWLN